MCGIFGIYGHTQASYLTFLGLYALQHRGQESAGIVVSDGREVHAHLGMGLVSEVFSPEIVAKLKGHIAIGHVRYSTTGSSHIRNAQPFLTRWKKGYLAVAHNGNLVNSLSLREKLEKDGALFQTTLDSELLIHLIVRSRKKDIVERIVDALSQLKGAYSFLISTEDRIFAVRDPHGFRPLALGDLGGVPVISSETCAFDLIGARFLREIEPGEIIEVDSKGVKSYHPFKKVKPSYCIFEFIYFARPDSWQFGGSVYITRKKLGARLYEEAPTDVDMVVPIPDSGNYAALGYALRGNLPFEMAVIRNHYVGRTFIQPSQEVRDLGVRVKLNPCRDILKGKRITVVEDSIVRGTTSRMRMRTLREAGVKEIHMRVSCPPHRYPCFYGIDFPNPRELAANIMGIEGIRKFLGLDSLHYLSLEGMLSCMPEKGEHFCTACFTGDYPVKPEEKVDKFILERR
ncbi:MAG TPA: amidophosphoribosyltransferase [bacterium]|nr:amidophosphoribosyltransferase [bacterium]HEX68136.1 amidophosphoribosyltransferase [bacterium]